MQVKQLCVLPYYDSDVPTSVFIVVCVCVRVLIVKFGHSKSELIVVIKIKKKIYENLGSDEMRCLLELVVINYVVKLATSKRTFQVFILGVQIFQNS